MGITYTLSIHTDVYGSKFNFQLAFNYYLIITLSITNNIRLTKFDPQTRQKKELQIHLFTNLHFLLVRCCSILLQIILILICAPPTGDCIWSRLTNLAVCSPSGLKSHDTRCCSRYTITHYSN